MEQSEGDPLASLEVELNTWRKTMFERLAKRTDAFPALKAAVRYVSGDEQKQVEPEDIRVLLIAVVAAAEASEPPGVVADRRVRYGRPAVIREVFGLTANTKNVTAKDRFIEAGKVADPEDPVPHDTMRDEPLAYARQLATWIREYLDQQLPSVEVAPVAKTSLLIQRDDDLAWLRDTYEGIKRQGGGIFQLWGIAGVGKTTLATQFADQVGPRSVIGMIRIGRRGLYEDDLRSVVRLEGHDDSAWSDDYCLTKFRTIARQLRNVRLLILDNVQDQGDVSDLLPRGSNVPVLITAQTSLHLDDLLGDEQVAAWQVQELSATQTIVYLRRQLPGLSDETAHHLARMVGGHAETIAHIVHYLNSPEAVTAEELLAEFSQEVSATLTRLNASKSLSILVERLFQQIPKGEYSWAILACVVWTNELGEQTLDLVIEMLAEWNGARPTWFKVDTALGQLEHLGLIRRTSDSLRVSPLTCLVLRDLLIRSFVPVLRAYERVISVPPSNSANGSRVIRMLRDEYDYARPMGDELAEDNNNSRDPKPALFCIDTFNWAFFLTVPHDGQIVRMVRLFRVAPTGLFALDPGDRQWRLIRDGEAGAEYLLIVTRRYFQLVSKGYHPS